MTKKQIVKWLEEALKRNQPYVIIFNYEDLIKALKEKTK